MVYIYVLKLGKGKYYVGKTNQPNFRIKSHFNSKGSEWTKTYWPIAIEKLIPNCDNYDEDKWTKIYMDIYGIDNVRGGSFTKLRSSPKERVILRCQIPSALELQEDNLDDEDFTDNALDETKKLLRQISNGTNDKCFKCGKKGHFAKDCNSKSNQDKKQSQYVRIWTCIFCGKEFDTIKGAEFHDIRWCKKKKLNSNRKPSLKCFRCGRNGHYEPNCYAKKHINGYYL